MDLQSADIYIEALASKAGLALVDDSSQLKTQMIIILLFLFLVFVVLDVATTQWLIIHSPGGIINEINPIGILLYENLGSAAMIFPKFILFIIFAVMAVVFTMKYSHIKWFVEMSQALVLIQVALSLIVSFNNFVAILAVLYVGGTWPLAIIPKNVAILGIFVADVGLGAIFANGIMYMWGLTRKTMHLKVFVGLLVFITPVLLFSEGFRVYLWLFAVYIASASSALGIAFYITESKKVTRKDQVTLDQRN